MNSVGFEPAVTERKDRLVRSMLTPGDVFAAVQQSDQAQKQLAHWVERGVENLNVFTRRDLQTFLPTLTVDSLRSAAVLGEYQNALIVQAQSDPSLTPFIGRVAQERFKAEVNALYAFALTQQVNGIPINTVSAPIPANQPIPNPYPSRVPQPPVTPPVTPPTPPPEQPNLSPEGLSQSLPNINSTGFVTQPSGLRIEEVRAGVGTPVAAGDNVTVFYAGWLASNGNLFDSNYVNRETPTPTTFNTEGVIEGFREGLIGMRPGQVRRLFIPSELGYGSIGSGSSIPPNSDLVFEVLVVANSRPTGV